MTKNSSKPGETRSSSMISGATSGVINVFNTGFRQVGQVIRIHNGGPGTKGPPLRTVKFLPGNNEIDQSDWELCKQSKAVQTWLSPIDRFDSFGNIVKGKTLIEGHVDNRYKSTSTDLAIRMAAAQSVKLAITG